MLIGFVGKARSGKDTAGEHLVKNFGYTRISFADELKRVAMKYFVLNRDECYDNKTQVSRRILQGLGECMREEIDLNYWVNYALKNVPENVAITDVRFLNEADIIKKSGGILIKIERANSPDIEYGVDHKSEVELEQIKCDAIILNISTLDSFYDAVESTIKVLQK